MAPGPVRDENIICHPNRNTFSVDRVDSIRSGKNPVSLFRSLLVVPNQNDSLQTLYTQKRFLCCLHYKCPLPKGVLVPRRNRLHQREYQVDVGIHFEVQISICHSKLQSCTFRSTDPLSLHLKNPLVSLVRQDHLANAEHML